MKRFERLESWALAAALLLILVLIGLDTRAKHLVLVGPSGRLEIALDGGVGPLSPQRRTDDIPDHLFRDDDAYYWLAFARAFLENPDWRVRHTHVDNVPFGREVHWSSGPVWSLASLTALVAAFSERPLPQALEVAGFAFHPLLLAALVIVTGLTVRRRLPLSATIALTSCFLLAPVLGRDATYGALDHHLPLFICALGSVVCLLIGGAGFVPTFSQTPPEDALRRSRRWIIASALFAGAGLWIQAIFQVVLVGGIVIGALIACGLLRMQRDEALFVPELWRVWGLSGAAASLFFYLLEYFPSEMGMRLEVNHPLHALAFAAGGEAVCRLARLRLGRPRAAQLRDLWVLLLCLAGGLLLPAAILWGPVAWFTLHDPVLERIHRMVIGFRPVSMLFGPQNSSIIVLLKEVGILPLLLLAAFVRVFRPRDDLDRTRILVSLLPALIAAALYIGYVRNASLFVATMTGLGVAVLWPAAGRRPSRFAIAAALLLFIVNGAVWFESWRSYQRFAGSDRFSRDWIVKMAYRDVAQAMRAEISADQRVAIVDSVLAPSMHYFGGFAVSAGLYWENLEGQTDTVRFFAAYDDRESLEIARRRDVRHVVLWAIPPAPRRWHFLEYGWANDEAVGRTLGARLVESRDVLGWLTDVSHRYDPATRYRVKVYRIADQVPMLAATPSGVLMPPSTSITSPVM